MNNINGIINKDLIIFFFSVWHQISTEGKTKTARINQKTNFLIFLFFFLKIQDLRKPKTSSFERGEHKNFLGQVLTIFQISPQLLSKEKHFKLINDKIYEKDLERKDKEKSYRYWQKDKRSLKYSNVKANIAIFKVKKLCIFWLEISDLDWQDFKSFLHNLFLPSWESVFAISKSCSFSNKLSFRRTHKNGSLTTTINFSTSGKHVSTTSKNIFCR